MDYYFILPDLASGGAERVIITIARILKRNGFHIKFIILCNGNSGEILNWIKPEFEIISFDSKRTIYAIYKLMVFMRNHPISVFFSSREHVNIIGLLCSIFTNSKYIVRIPNMPKNKLSFGKRGLKEKIIKRLNKLILPKSHCIIAQNNEMQQQLIEYYNLNDQKVIVVNNPIDRDYVLSQAEKRINPFDDNVNFLCICNVAYSKGIDVLINAWKYVIKTIPNAHLHVIGRINSEYAQNIINKADKTITFLGYKENPYPYFKYCDVFVLPSRMEGFPNVVLEAMCFNKPVAATTCVNVIKDIIIFGENGFYCPIEDEKALADIMLRSVNLKEISNNYNMFDKDILINIFKC